MNKKINVLKKIAFGLLFITTCVLTLSIGTDFKINNNKIILSADTWKTNLIEVDKYEDTSLIKYVDISSIVLTDGNGLVTGVDTNVTINENTRILINDGLGVYYFSELCNDRFANQQLNSEYERFLTYHYELGANIDYEEASKTFKMLRPIGWSIPFSGTFDGKCHTITNIFYRPFNDASEVTDLYKDMVYLSWFSQNTGTIKNLGIINPNIIQYDIYDKAVFVSPFVGSNSGSIENCYVQDLRGNEAGIAAEGGYELSMFVSVNTTEGTIKNSYVASNKIAATSVTMSSSINRHPFVAQNNNATGIKNCYFDKEALTKYTTYNSRFENGSTYTEEKNGELVSTIVNDGVTPLNTSDFTNTEKFNHKDIDDEEKQIWYSNGTYSRDYTPYFRLNYPQLIGFETNEDGYFIIETATQLVYMSELIDQYQVFRDAKYLLVKTVDLNTVKPGSFVFTQSIFGGEFKGASKANDGYDVKLANGTSSDKNSILNLNINVGNSYQGYHCYGLFGVLSGTVENINIVNANVNQDDLTTVNYDEKNAVGTVCGLLVGGKIKDVCVYTDINLQQGSSTTFLGTQYVGGICGIAQSGEIINSTTNGTIKSPIYTPTSNNMSVNYSASIGGILGRAEENDGVKNCLNNIDIISIQYSSNPGTSLRQYLGGVIGSGNINNTYQLQNNGDIIVGSSEVTNTYYSTVYAGGVIGRVNDATNSNGIYFNNGDIHYHVNNNNYKAYISGVMNVISDIGDKYDTFTASVAYNTIVSELANQKPFEFTSLTNGGTLYIENNLTASRYPAKYQVITNISSSIDIRAAGIVYSYLTKMNVTGAYNLDKHYTYNSNGETVEVANGPQSIDISMLDEYAPAFNADNQVAHATNELHLDTNYIHSKSNTIGLSANLIKTTIDLERVYNYRDVNYITNNVVNSYMLQLSGCINGRNFNLKNIRNDGNVKVYFTQATHTNMKMDNSTYRSYFGDYKKLKAYGVMEEVSLDHKAEDIYNGGNITLSSNGVTANFNIYVAGICYKNVGNDKPNNDIMIEKGYVGSLHNCINNGEIRFTNGDIINNTSKVTAPGAFYGVTRAGGITCINSSTISQTFNLGDVYNINGIINKNTNTYGNYTSEQFEVETGGFCFIMQNEEYDSAGNLTSANIIDSANNGVIVSMNTNNNKGFTNAGGFVGRNDRGEDGELVNENSSSERSHTSKIQYSINYGDIYAYNNYTSVIYTGEQQSKAAGFVCLGACTLVDVINYGNIYGNSVSAGMFGFLYISRMRSAGLSPTSPIYIANSINYGKIKVAELTSSNQNKILDIGNTNETITTYNSTSLPSNNGNTRIYVAGALIGAWGFGQNADDINSINVKYLVNFDDEVNILGNAYQAADATTAAKRTMLENMATTKANDTSPAPFDTDDTNYNYGIKCYTKDISAGDHNLTDIYSQEYNGGIFHEDYSLRNPGELILDANGNIDMSNTDNFIADYIQFVPYSKVNDYLVEKIGLKDTVLQNAWNLAVNSSNVIETILIAKNQSGSFKDIYEELIAEQTAKLNSSKIDIVQVFAEEISKGTITSEDLHNIVNILTSNGNDLSNLSTDSINDIYSVLLTDSVLLSTKVGNENKTVLDVIYDYLIDSNINFVPSTGSADDPINSILSDFAQSATTDAEKQLVINIYTSLINDDDTLQNYIDSLSQTEKENIANRIYTSVMIDENVIRTIGESYYDDLNLTTSSELNTLVQNIISERRTSGSILADYPITDDEYMAMYDSFYNNSITNQQVQNAINNLSPSQLENLTSTIKDRIQDTNTDLYQFIDSGRSKSEGIILRSSSVNYIAVVNSTTGEYSDSDTPNNNQTYTGTFTSISGTDPKDTNNVLEVLIVLNAHYRQKSGTQTYRYTWIYEDGEYTGRRNTNNPTGTYYGIINSTQTVTFQNSDMGFRSTGVYALRSQNANTYNYSNIQIGSYIDYGLNATPETGDLTLETFKQMTDLSSDDNYSDYVREYLYKIYVNSQTTAGKAEFLKLLFAVTLNMALNYIETQTTNADATDVNEYSNYILDNITDTYAQGNIVKLFTGNNGSDYTDVLFEMLVAYGSTDYDLISEIIGQLYVNRETINNTNSINNNVTDILESNYITDQNKVDVLAEYSNDVVKKYAIGYLLTNDLLSDVELQSIFLELLESDITLLKNESINTYLNEEVFLSVSAAIIKGSETLFKEYTGLTSPTTIIEDLENMGVDSTVVTDNTGIYALASSHGILNGLFIPDNIELIDMDYYYTDSSGSLVNDPTWRGGTQSNQNAYVDENGNNKTDSVNYKVYYEMKQLKKSIATIIFNMELVDDVVDEYGVHENTLYNNTAADYICAEKNQYGVLINEVYFYVPINHNIIKTGNTIYVNMTDGSYELSYGATFDTVSDNLEIIVPDVSTINVGDVLTDTFVIQAEDTTVKATYTLNLVITEASYLYPLDEVLVDGNNVTASTNITYDVLTDVTTSNAVVGTKVTGYNGTIRVTYTTKNLINRGSLLEFVKVYSTPSNTIADALSNENTTKLVLNEQYRFNKVDNNGIVIIDGLEEDETGYNHATNAYNDGSVFFDLSIDNYMPGGYYLIEIALNDTTKYYVLFEKAKSSNTSLESLTYNNQVYEDGGNNNYSDMSTHPYGTILTQTDLTTISNNKPDYLDDIVIAPLARLDSVTATVTETDGIKTYEVVLNIVAEDGTEGAFTHYITEEQFNTAIQTIYLNGGIAEVGPIVKDANNTYIYESSFSKYETPSYKFEYDLSHFYTTVDSSYFKVVYYDANGNEIKDEVTIELLDSYCSINVIEGKDFEISFYEEAASIVYYFGLIYENQVEFNQTITNSWDVVFDIIKIEKFKNTNSYFDNVTFLSESVVSSIRTMITVDNISLQKYEAMLSDPTREIVALPGKIHYNEYAIDKNKQDQFYMIGLVNKTQLDFYTPTFTLPEGGSVYRIEVIEGVVYRYVPYYIDNQQDLTIFLISEDGTIIKDEGGTTLTGATMNDNIIVYNGNTYKLSDVAGLQTIEINDEIVENTSLRTNYNEFGSFDEDTQEFNYVTYRVYSEIYDGVTYKDDRYYTDYHISAQDLTNNIRFDIVISYEDDASAIVDSVYSVFVEFTCYALPEDALTGVREDYKLLNRAGLFAYFANNSNILTHGDLQANVAGYYGLYVALTDGYTYSFILYDSLNGKDSEGNTNPISGKAGGEIFIRPSITARTVEIHIIIEKADSQKDDWGVHVKDESFIIKNEE